MSDKNFKHSKFLQIIKKIKQCKLSFYQINNPLKGKSCETADSSTSWYLWRFHDGRNKRPEQTPVKRTTDE